MSSRSLRVPTFTDPPDSERSGVVCVFKALEKEYNKIFRTTIYQFQKWNFFITSNEPLNLFKKQLEDIETEVKLKIVPASCVVVEFTSRTQDEHFELWIEKCYEVLEKCFRDLVLLILSGPQDNIQHLFREIEKSGMVGDDSLSIFEMKGATEIFLLERGEVVFDLIMSMQKHMENIRIWSPETREGILFNVFTIPDLQYRLNRVFKGTEKTMLEYPYVQIYQSGMIIKIMGNENDCATASNYLKANSWMAGIHFEICEYFDGFLFFLDRKNVQECIDRQIATINGTWAVIRPPQSNEMLLVYGNTSHDTNMIINILLESIKVREYGVLNSTDTEDIVNKWKLHAEHLEKSLQGKLCLLTNTKRKVGFVNLTFVYTSDLEEEESLKILFRQVELRVPGKESIQMKAKHFIWLKEYYMEFLQTEAKRTGVTIDFVQEKNEVKIAGLSSALMEIKQLINSVCPKELILLLPFEALPSKVTDFLRECQCCFVYSPFKNSRLWIKGNTGIVVYKGESGTKCLYYDVQVKPVESEGKDTVIEWLNDEKTALLKFPLWREGGTREKNQIEEVLQLLFTEVKKQNKKYVAFDLQNLAIWPMKTCVKSIIDCVPKPPEGLIIWISHPDENAFQTVIDCLKEAEFTKTEGDIKSSKIELRVVKGRIAKLQEKVDVIVNTTSLSLDMTSGAVSASILEAAGDGLKTEIAQIPADLTTGRVIRVNYGDVAETFGYRLNCERIFHGALYKWKDDQEKAMDVLRQFVRNCISLADERKFKTLAFSAIGTGQLKIPSVLVATSVKSIVEEYAASNDHKHVEKILFVIHEKDEENFKVFRTILEHENAAWKTRETPEIPVLYRFSVYGEEQNVVGAMIVLAALFREHVHEKYELAMSQKEEKKETNQQKSVQVQPVVRTRKDFSVTVNFASKAIREPCQESFSADFLELRKWSFIFTSKKMKQNFLHSGFQASVSHFGRGHLDVDVFSSSEMSESQFLDWKTSFYEEVEKLDVISIELQGSEMEISVLNKELDGIENIADILDVFKFDNQPSFIYIQGLPEDIIFIFSSKFHQIHSMDMIDPYTRVKQGYCTLEMNEPAWNFVETFNSIEKARKTYKTVHFCKVDKKVCGIGDAESVEDVKNFFCDGLYIKGIPHRIIKDFPIHVLEFMKRKSLQMTIYHKVKKHGMWLIDKDNGLHFYGKTENELKIIEGVIRRFILWKKIPLQRNALPFFGEKLEKMLASCTVQKVLDTKKFSVEIVGVTHSEHPSVLLIYTADIADEPSFIDFLKELEENLQYEKKIIELSYHSYLEEFCMNDIRDVATNKHVKVDFSKIPGRIHIEGPMVGVNFFEEYLGTFKCHHLVIPVPNLEDIVQKIDDLKERTCPSIKIFEDKKAKMWLTQTMSVMVYCNQPSDALDRHVSVIPEVTENKELSRKQENIQWETVNQSSVHLRCPKWQSGDHKDKHLMRDTIEEMMNQMRTYAKTSVLFCLHEFPSWPVDKLVKSIISSTRNLKGHLKIILIDPDEENCKKVNETLRVSLNDSDEKAVYFVDVWGAENVCKAVSAELDTTLLKETQKMRPSEKVKQTKLRESPEQTMSFRDASGMEKPNQERTLSDDSEQNEEKRYPAGNEEERSCLVVTFVSRQVDTEKIAKITKSFNPKAVIHPYEKENMALIVFENATDAAKVIEQYKKNPEVEIMLDFLPNQAVVCIHAQISSMFLEKFKDKIGLQKGIETSSGVRVKEIPGRKWLLTGSLPQIHLAHKYLRNELTKIKSATEHSIQSQGTGKTPPQSTTAQTVDHANTLDISKSRRSQRSFNAESPSTGGSAFPSQKSNVNQLVIQMEEIQYEILLFFHSYWSGKELCRQFTYENGNLKLTGNKENIEKLESELTALLAEINRDQLKSQDLVFKDLLKNVKKREQLEVFVKYFENLDSCWLEFAGFSNEKINELKDNLVREIEKEKKAIESRKLPVAEGGTSVNEEPNNVQRFYTNENLEIKVYKGSITNLNVECIVSSNTRKLENFMGVAKAIANAAGPGFTEECKALVKAKGEIEKGFCCTTGPGKLPYRYVIHVVGPIWTAKSNSDVGSILKQSILSILKEATRLGVRSVALPAISAGQNHANKKLCTRIYAEAVCLFSSEQPQLKYSTLKEIHFIDRENGMVELIGKGFKEHFESNAFQTKVQVQRSSIGKPPVMSTVFKPYCQIRMMKGGQAEEYNLTEFFKVITWLGDILEFPHDYAVCCGQDSDFKSSSNIAKQFKSQQDVKKQISDIKKNQGPFRTGDVFQVKSKDCMIYYVIIKSFTERTRNMEEFLSDVTFCVKKTLCKAEESQEKAIAVPLLGTGNKGAQKSRATKAWIEGVLHFLRETFSKSSHHLREVYFVSSSQEDVATMASLFKQRIDSCKSVQSVVFDSFV